MEKKRSIGVIVFGVIILIYSLYLIFPLLPFQQRFFSYFVRLLYPFPGGFFNLVILTRHISQYTLFFLGLIYLILSINILRLRNWSRLSVVYLSGLIGGLIIIDLASEILSSGGMGGIGLAISLAESINPLFFSFLFIIFFTRAKVKEQFKQ